MGLCLTLHSDEKIVIGGLVHIMVYKPKSGSSLRVRIDAPKEVRVSREKLTDSELKIATDKKLLRVSDKKRFRGLKETIDVELKDGAE